ncbi:MAG: hypothetical protein QM564_11920 [Bergeyella sp.]
MDAKELRIGNLIYFKLFPNVPESFTIIEVNAVADTHISFVSEEDGEETYSIEDFQGIPLSEERLLKFGFQYSDLKTIRNGYYLRVNNSDIAFYDDEVIYYLGQPFSQIKYVHQLQNFYHCLCGKELEFKK